MIELNQLRKNKEEFVLSLKKRGLDDIENDLNKLISLDDERKSLKTKLDNLLYESNKTAKERNHSITEKRTQYVQSS